MTHAVNSPARELHLAGVEACRLGQFEKGIGRFKEAIRASPQTTEFHQWLFSAMLAWARQQPEMPEILGQQVLERISLPFFSVIVCSINPQKFLRLKQNVESLIPKKHLEIICISDARNMGEGYNRGARQAGGEILIFCHDDIEFLTPDIGHRLADHLNDYDLVGVAGSTWLRDAQWGSAGLPYSRGQVIHALTNRAGYTYSVFGLDSATSGGIQSLDGLFMAMRRNFWAENQFDEGYDGFHLYDVDMSFRCYLAGHRVGVCNDILIEHRSLGRFDDSWKRAAERFIARFGNRLERHCEGVIVCSNCRLNNREQVFQLFRALRRFGYGADIPVATA